MFARISNRIGEYRRERESKRSEEARKKQVEQFCINAGRTFIFCSLVEHQLHEMLLHFGYEDTDLPAWVARISERKRLGKAIGAIQERFVINDVLVQMLNEFNERRNTFVHNLWDREDASMISEEGQQKLRLEMLELTALGRVLSKKLNSFIVRSHGERGGFSTKGILGEE